MKKRIINLIIAVLFTTATTFAGNITSITTDGSKAFIVDTKMWKSEYLSVEIRDNVGVLILKDRYATKNGKRFNFKNLPHGSYSILLENDMKSFKQGFIISSNEIELLPNVITVFNPVIAFRENQIDLNYLANSTSTSVSIYGTNNEIFTITYDNQISINKRFDTSRLPKGHYTFNVSSGNKTHSKSFRK